MRGASKNKDSWIEGDGDAKLDFLRVHRARGALVHVRAAAYYDG